MYGDSNMKTVLFAFTLSLLFNFNSAALADAQTPMPLCQKRASALFGGRDARGTRVLPDGTVESFSPNRTVPIKHLTPQELVDLQKAIDAMTGPLVDMQPRKPRCHNTFVLTYSALQSNGQTIVFAKNAGCHTYLAQNSEPVREFLDQLEN